MFKANFDAFFTKIGAAMLLFMAPFLSFGQNDAAVALKKCPINTINYEQGLMNNEVTDVITDPLGFTWVSTVIGMQRFNGYAMETINPVIGRDTIKIRSRVHFFNLKSGCLWICCTEGIIEYNPVTNLFRRVISLKTDVYGYYSIIPIKETDQGIWCIRQKKGLVIYSREGKLLSTENIIDPAVTDKLFERYEWEGASNDQFIFIRHPDHFHIFQIDIASHQLVATRDVSTMVVDMACNDKSMYINTLKGVCRFSIAGWKQLTLYPFNAPTESVFGYSHVCIINNNRILASVNKTLLEFNADLSSFKKITMLDGGPVLKAGDIGHIYYDQFERIWLICNDDVRRIQDRDVPFTTWRYPGEANNFVRCLYYDKEQRTLLAGCLNGGLLLYDDHGDPLWSAPLVSDTVRDILAIDKISKEKYLVITWGKGWYLLDAAKRQLKALALPGPYGQKLRVNLFTNNIQRVNDSTIVAGAAEDVFRVTFRGDALTAIDPLMPLLRNGNQTTSLLRRSDGSTWVGCVNGSVFCIDKTGKIRELKLPEQLMIRSMAEDDRHNIWVGTIAGLYVFKADGTLINSFSKSSGLLNDCIYSMLPVENTAQVFAGTNLGLARISLNNSIKNYTKELGLQDDEFNTNASLRTPDGRFFFGGVNGISVFKPALLTQFIKAPILNVTRLVVNDSTLNASSGIWKGDTISLRYDQNHLQFDFAAMGLFNADKYLYRYRITGFEKKWQSTYQPTGIRYTLSPGTYHMEMSCINPLSGQGLVKNLTIIIHSPWWETWWFLTSLGLAVVATVTRAVSIYNKRKYQKELDTLKLKQTLQNERERLSRDLHDNLGAQANAIFYGTEQLKHVNGHSTQLVNDLHDTAGDMLTVLRETLWAMRISQVGAAELWFRILNFAKKLGPYYPHLKIEIAGTPPDAILLNASTALNLILIVQEAINNAIRHSGASVITITSYNSDNYWQIEIADNGKGFDVHEVKQKTESYGIDNMNERAVEAKIDFNINSVVSHGTKVSLGVDLRKAELQVNA